MKKLILMILSFFFLFGCNSPNKKVVEFFNDYVQVGMERNFPGQPGFENYSDQYDLKVEKVIFKEIKKVNEDHGAIVHYTKAKVIYKANSKLNGKVDHYVLMCGFYKFHEDGFGKIRIVASEKREEIYPTNNRNEIRGLAREVNL